MSTFYAKYSGVGGGGGGGGGNLTDVNGQTGPSITIAAGSGISVNSASNIITIANTVTGSEYTEYHVISSGEAAAKAFNLTYSPLTPSECLCDVIGGVAQQFGVDFTISVNVFSWNGLALDGILSAGDVIRLNYVY